MAKECLYKYKREQQEKEKKNKKGFLEFGVGKE